VCRPHPVGTPPDILNSEPDAPACAPDGRGSPAAPRGCQDRAGGDVPARTLSLALPPLLVEASVARRTDAAL